MSSLNRATLIGNVGKDTEIRTTQSGQKVATFSIATTETWKDKQTGEKKESTDWHTVVCFNDGLVGVIERFVKKGSKVMVEGAIKTRKWQDQQGQDRYTTEIVLKFDAKLILLGGRDGGGQSGGYDDGDAGYGGGNQRSGGSGNGSRGGSGHAGSGHAGSGASGGRPAPNYDLDDQIPF